MSDDEVEYVHIKPKLNKGREVVSPVSLVAVSNARPVTLGERIRRYMKSPRMMQDIQRDDYHDEDVEEIGDWENPMSIHEDRAKEITARVRERKKKEAAEAKQAAIDKEKAENELFRKRFKQMQAAGSIPPETTPEEE